MFFSARICDGSGYNIQGVCQNVVGNSTAECVKTGVELLNDYQTNQVFKNEILVCKVDGAIEKCVCAGQLPRSIIKFDYDASERKCHSPEK